MAEFHRGSSIKSTLTICAFKLQSARD